MRLYGDQLIPQIHPKTSVPAATPTTPVAVNVETLSLCKVTQKERKKEYIIFSVGDLMVILYSKAPD